MIKKITLTTVTVLMVLVMSTGWGLAMNGNGAGDGSGPIHDIFSGTPFEYTGLIIACVPGEGVTISVDGEPEVIYGIGPASYWEEQGLARPAVGEEITVIGYTVVCDSVSLNIATKVLVGEVWVDLRDEDGMPLWR
jgi:hypothetical protein